MGKMVGVLRNILAWVLKNTALLVGIVEAVSKLAVAIINITPTKADDPFVPIIDNVASYIKKYLYKASDLLAGKPENIPNS